MDKFIIKYISSSCLSYISSQSKHEAAVQKYIDSIIHEARDIIVKTKYVKVNSSVKMFTEIQHYKIDKTKEINPQE